MLPCFFVLLVAPPYLILSPVPLCSTACTAHIIITPYSVQTLNAHVIITMIFGSDCSPSTPPSPPLPWPWSSAPTASRPSAPRGAKPPRRRPSPRRLRNGLLKRSRHRGCSRHSRNSSRTRIGRRVVSTGYYYSVRIITRVVLWGMISVLFQSQLLCK